MNRPACIFYLATCFFIGCASDEAKLRARADNGEAEAQYRLASMYWDGKDVDQNRSEAVKWYQQAAHRGHREAEMRLAEIYESGRAVPQDYHRAAEWYQRAAKQGDMNARIQLARFYLKGSGVPQNYEEARKLLQGPAERGGHAEAQYLLGIMYLEGRGGPTDNVLAHMWFNLAAAQGHKAAESMRLVAATNLNHNQLMEAQRLAVQHSKEQSGR